MTTIELTACFAYGAVIYLACRYDATVVVDAFVRVVVEIICLPLTARALVDGAPLLMVRSLKALGFRKFASKAASYFVLRDARWVIRHGTVREIRRFGESIPTLGGHELADRAEEIVLRRIGFR